MLTKLLGLIVKKYTAKNLSRAQFGSLQKWLSFFLYSNFLSWYERSLRKSLKPAPGNVLLYESNWGEGLIFATNSYKNNDLIYLVLRDEKLASFLTDYVAWKNLLGRVRVIVMTKTKERDLASILENENQRGNFQTLYVNLGNTADTVLSELSKVEKFAKQNSNLTIYLNTPINLDKSKADQISDWCQKVKREIHFINTQRPPLLLSEMTATRAS